MMKRLIGGLASAALVTGIAMAQDSDPTADKADATPINAIQVVGTHNSYSIPADPRVMALMVPRLSAFTQKSMDGLSAAQRLQMEDEHPGGLTDMAKALDYVQMPLQAQLRSGVRSIEIDLQPDPKGGAYLDPLPYRLLREQGATDLAPLYREELAKPGMKVFHVADLDFRSQCPTFRSCLMLMKQWSDAEPGHSPVFVLLEPKLSGLERAVPGATAIPPFDKAAFEEIDGSIRSILGSDKLFTPDDLRGDMSTLEAAALKKRWPTLAQARGKFLFLFLVPGMNLAVFAPYLDGHASLEGRVAFVQGQAGMAHTAFMLFDNAMTHGADIRAAVRKGYLVRTRADIDTVDARQNAVARRDAALASGAQIISTDYLNAPNVYGNGYHLAPFSGGWRCNNIVARCGGIK